MTTATQTALARTEDPAPAAPALRRPLRENHRDGAGALDLIDEAALRLRLEPLGTLGVYYAGSLPFILGLLYFWTDMSRSPDAALDAPAASLGMVALFVGMKTAQAVFAARLRAGFARRPPVRWTWRRLARLALVQTVLQPSGLFLLPVAAVLTVPLGWVYAFYASVTALGDGETGTARAVLARATRAAMRDARGNHLALLILSLLGLFAWLNLAVATLLLPQLAQIFTGEENVFTRSGLHIFNSTYFAVTFGLVYLAVDPLIKTFYALRCFYADAQSTGEDLRRDLRALPPPDTGVGAMAVLAAALCLLSLPSHATAASAGAAATPRPTASVAIARDIPAPILGRSIEDALRRREFAWRAPRPPERPTAAQAGPIGRFLAGVEAWIGRVWTQTQRLVHVLVAKIRRWLHRPDNSVDESGTPGGLDPATLRALIYGLTVLFTGTLLLIVWRSRRRLRARILPGQALPTGPIAAPDLADETLLASQLPEDDWLRLARELLARGERRLALRALYLSTLAALETRGLLAIARHKSNRDYLVELRRRARDRTPLLEAFARNVGRFERVWYGPHAADETLLEDFQADRELSLASGPPL